MKIALISDVHLSVHPLPFPETRADVIVLAGDIARPQRAMEWARAATRPTLYVAGNHEFYGSDLVSTYELLRKASEGTQVRILERAAWVHEGVRFLGCTLWSDFRLFESEAERAESVRQSTAFTRDYSHIKLAPDFGDRFTPAVSQLLFMQSVAWLEECFAAPHDGPTVVITHFAPTPGSISPQFAGSPVNACFVSDLGARIERWQPALWLHGHTHDGFDYRIGKTRVVCNARGYAKNAVPENARFDPDLVIDLPQA